MRNKYHKEDFMKKLMLVTLLVLSFIAINAEETRSWFGLGITDTRISGDYVKKLESTDSNAKITELKGFVISFTQTEYVYNNFFSRATYQLAERGWVLETDDFVQNIRNNYFEGHGQIGYTIPILKNVFDSIDPFAGIGISAVVNSSHYKMSDMRWDFPISIGLDIVLGRTVLSSMHTFGTQNIIKNEKVKYQTYNFSVGYLLN